MIHLQKFIDRVQGFEARGIKDFTMPMTDAKAMHADLTKLLLELETLRTDFIKNQESEVITVQVGGGTFK